MSELLEYKGYYANVDFSAEDDVFFGKLIGINDLVTFEGDSVSELKSAFHEAVEDYLETCKEIGKSPDKTYKGSFNVRIPADLHRKAALVAAQQHLSLNDFVRQAIDLTIGTAMHTAMSIARAKGTTRDIAKSKKIIKETK